VERHPQQTIGRSVTIRGIALHTGRHAEMALRPAAPDSGISFRRTDLDGPVIPACLAAVSGTAHRVSLGGSEGVQTVEHVLSAAWALGIHNLSIEVDGEEIPGMDGSALPVARALLDAGIEPQPAARKVRRITDAVWVGEGDTWAVALPAPRFTATCAVRLDPPGPGDQAATFDPERDAYEETIAPARTWGYESGAEALWRQGLARGASLENTLVVGGSGFLNAPRFENEAARHKIVDLLGDLALLGHDIHGAVITVRAGHRLHVELARALSAWEG
jgi:UDP-3-O-[3-hydroxymyristoyl] N-acetylglucosamine deacetylase